MGAFNRREDGLERAVGTSAAQAHVVVVSRARHILAAPETVFAALAEPSALAGILPRVKRMELLEHGNDTARVLTHMQITPFNTIHAEGQVHWRRPREIVFRTTQPTGVETRFELRPTASGTNVYLTLTLDLAPLLGPLAAFVPHEQVARVAAPDLDATLEAIARAVEKH